MAKPLTAASVARLKADAQRREVLDGACQGLYLVIQPTGVKSWAMRFRRPDGRQGKLTLGRVDFTSRESSSSAEPVIGAPLTLGAARRLALSLQHQRAVGRDVIAAAKRAKADRKGLAANTFASAAADFIEQYAMRKTRGWRETARLVGLRADEEGALKLIPNGLVERWSERAITDIDGDDIYGVVEETRERGVPGAERRAQGPTDSRAVAMYAALSKMFSWLLSKRRLNQNPCAGVARPAAPGARDRVLSNAELVAFWRAASAERGEFATVLKLLLLTGQRLNEVAGMRRAELSDDFSVWTIPSERTKNRRAHVVPLPPFSREILAAVPASGELVFTTNGAVPITVGDRVKERLDAQMKLSYPWRFHDLRRTAATGMAEIGIQPHIVEAVLNHVSGHRAGVAGIYNRAAYAAEKKAALELWAAHVERLISGGRGQGRPVPVIRLQE
jgi:integrase